MSRADDLDVLLNAAVDDYDAGRLSGAHSEGSGLVVVGESGSGKTTEINQALIRLKQTRASLESGIETKFVQIALDGETTWKALGIQVLNELGYEMSAKRTEHEIWARIRIQLQGQGIWLLHIDECQHMFQTLGEKETRKVINALKTFMKHRQWPVVIILSGIPELLDKVNLDPQFRNLMSPVAMRPLNPLSDDLDELDTAFYQMAESIGADIEDIRDEDTYRRMAYGHQNMYGRVFRFMVDVLATLPDGSNRVNRLHMAQRYAAKTGCLPGQNVFERDDYEKCNVAQLMAES
ncbi:MAG: ATP-binding protein [Paracoccus denitrificans]|uniref:ATP-binding protein n=1 Tax=Paracoccus denitrificans TaxID=266 RepID=A0A533I8V9_PARDE|nr:MAG: ATP-binding protein [Paracoccus denitrificans]